MWQYFVKIKTILLETFSLTTVFPTTEANGLAVVIRKFNISFKNSLNFDTCISGILIYNNLSASITCPSKLNNALAFRLIFPHLGQIQIEWYPTLPNNRLPLPHFVCHTRLNRHLNTRWCNFLLLQCFINSLTLVNTWPQLARQHFSPPPTFHWISKNCWLLEWTWIWLYLKLNITRFFKYDNVHLMSSNCVFSLKPNTKRVLPLSFMETVDGFTKVGGSITSNKHIFANKSC